MNVHHLELFYYVAKHGGISAAVRKIPYGIQQPAVSGQMRALEENAGAKLFDRSPFRLTPAGEKLFAHVRPFFDNLDAVAAELREGGADPELRIGASELVLRDHIPTVMQRLRSRHPRVKLALRSGYSSQLAAWLEAGEIDLAIGPVEARTPPKLRSLSLASVPLVLLVPRTSPVKTLEQLWAQKKITTPLVGLPASTTIMRSFQRGLKEREVVWPQAVEAASVELVTRYVANGEGYGVNIAVAPVIKHRDVRVLPLCDFEPMVMGLLWRGEPSAIVQSMIDEARKYSHETWPSWAAEDRDKAAI
ncbi:MAG: LysR family transcriptional regulator [Verrucomicrobiota bacterium]